MLVDRAGPEVLTAVKDGARVRLDEGVLYVDEVAVAAGSVLDAAEVAAQMTRAREGMAAHLASFTHNTSEFLSREQDLLLHGRGIPGTRTTFAGRPVVVVATGHEHREELKAVRRFVKEAGPVLVGVDGGADALLAAGHTPGRRRGHRGARPRGPGLGSGAEGRHRRGRPPGPGQPGHGDREPAPAGRPPAAPRDRGDRRGRRADPRPARRGVGDHRAWACTRPSTSSSTGGAAAVASTFLTRLAVGPTLVDASSLPLLYSGRVRPRHLLAVTVAGLLALGAAIATTPGGPGVGRTTPAPRSERGVDTVQGWLP